MKNNNKISISNIDINIVSEKLITSLFLFEDLPSDICVYLYNKFPQLKSNILYNKNFTISILEENLGEKIGKLGHLSLKI